jgi:hypothetical protein
LGKNKSRHPKKATLGGHTPGLRLITIARLFVARRPWVKSATKWVFMARRPATQARVLSKKDIFRRLSPNNTFWKLSNNYRIKRIQQDFSVATLLLI